MSVKELLDRVYSMPTGSEFDFKTLREEIHKEFERAASPHETVALIQLFNALADAIERNGGLTPSQLEQFRATREADYRLMITKEALEREDRCALDLLKVTYREIAAGRMSSDHPMHKLALKGAAELQKIAESGKPPVKQAGFWGRLMPRKRSN